jgi:hypothetical protein
MPFRTRRVCDRSSSICSVKRRTKRRNSVPRYVYRVLGELLAKAHRADEPIAIPCANVDAALQRFLSAVRVVIAWPDTLS